ncbi:MAG: recombinase family protein [Kofleriaceae bacterium]
MDPRGEAIGNKIEIHEAEAKIIRRIFRESLAGRSLTTIAHGLNSDAIPSPRVGTRHKCFGWGASTIRAILYNERYVGLWKFKERQWVKVPGTNKRQPRARDASEVMQQQRPELAILDRALWDAVQDRLAVTKRRYATSGGMRGELTYKRAPYVLSGLIVCRECGATMTMMGGAKYRYYRCQTNKTKGPGICANGYSVREDIARPKILDAIRERFMSPDGVMEMRKRVAGQLRDHSKKVDAELRERRERLKRTEEKMAGLADFIATGDRTQYIVKTLHDHEVFADQERAAIAALEEDARQPLYLPSIEEVEAQVIEMDDRLKQDPESAREQLRRWIKDGAIRVGPKDGAIVAEGSLLPLMVLDDGQTTKRPKRHLPETNPMVSGRYTIVAGARSAR